MRQHIAHITPGKPEIQDCYLRIFGNLSNHRRLIEHPQCRPVQGYIDQYVIEAMCPEAVNQRRFDPWADLSYVLGCELVGRVFD